MKSTFSEMFATAFRRALDAAYEKAKTERRFQKQKDFSDYQFERRVRMKNTEAVQNENERKKGELLLGELLRSAGNGAVESGTDSQTKTNYKLQELLFASQYPELFKAYSQTKPSYRMRINSDTGEVLYVPNKPGTRIKQGKTDPRLVKKKGVNWKSTKSSPVIWGVDKTTGAVILTEEINPDYQKPGSRKRK